MDEIYLNEKMRKENRRAASKIKLKGYIAPEDYEKLKRPTQNVNSMSMFLSQSSTDSFSISEQSFNYGSQSSMLSQNTDAVLSGISLSSFNETKSLGAIPETVNY